MGSVKSAVFSFLVTLIFCAVISSLVKKERASRILRPIFAVYILVAAASLTLFAVKNAKLPELSKYKETLSGGTLQNTYSDVISSLIFEQLKKSGYQIITVTCSVNIDKNGDIYCDEVYVTANILEKQNEEAMAELVRKYCNAASVFEYAG